MRWDALGSVMPHCLLALFISSCAAPDTRHQLVISTREQKLALLDRGNVIAGIRSPPPSSVSAIGEAAGTHHSANWRSRKKFAKMRHRVRYSKDRRRTGEIVSAGFAWPGPHSDAHSQVARTRGAKRQRVHAGYLHPRHAGGTADRHACQLWMHSNALGGNVLIIAYAIVEIGAAVTIVDGSLASAIPGFVPRGTLAIR